MSIKHVSTLEMKMADIGEGCVKNIEKGWLYLKRYLILTLCLNKIKRSSIISCWSAFEAIEVAIIWLYDGREVDSLDFFVQND